MPSEMVNSLRKKKASLGFIVSLKLMRAVYNEPMQVNTTNASIMIKRQLRTISLTSLCTITQNGCVLTYPVVFIFSVFLGFHL